MRDHAEKRRRPEDRAADDITGDRRETGRHQRIERELAQHDLKPEEQPRQRSVKRRRDPPGRSARDDDPQPTLRHPHQLTQRRGQRRADLHDRALTPDRATHADRDRRCHRLDDRHRRPDPPPVLGDGQHHLGHAMPPRLASEAIDQRTVDQTPQHRNHQHEPDPQPRQMRARSVTLLTELVMTRHQPRRAEHHLAKQRRAKTGPGPDHQRHHHQPQPITAQPCRRRPHHRPARRA